MAVRFVTDHPELPISEQPTPDSPDAIPDTAEPTSAYRPISRQLPHQHPVHTSEAPQPKLFLTMDDTGSWRVKTLGAIYTFCLSASPQTVERVPILGGPIPTSDRVRALESIVACQVGLPGYWFMCEPDQPGSIQSLMQLWNLSSQIQRIEPLK